MSGPRHARHRPSAGPTPGTPLNDGCTQRAEWRYEGPPLVSRIGRVTSVRLLRERGRGAGLSWEADRGILLTGVDGVGGLLLSIPETSGTAVFSPSVRLPRALLHLDVAPSPAVTARWLLGYGDWPAHLEVAVEVLRPWGGTPARAGVGWPMKL